MRWKSNVCTGCWRTMDEIMTWKDLDAEQMDVILERIEARKKA